MLENKPDPGIAGGITARVWGILKNPAYKGAAAFGKTRSEAWRGRLRPQRGRPAQPRRPRTRAAVGQQDWISIPVPPIVEIELFDSVQEQLRENQRRAQIRRKGSRFLLQGLICCAQCGYALCGNTRATPDGGEHGYYRCTGTDKYRFGGDRVCESTSVRIDLLDSAVWQQVRSVLDHPERLAQEYRRRMEAPHQRGDELTTTQAQLARLQQGVGRLIDSYTGGLISKEEFEPRIARMRERVTRLEAEAAELADQERVQSDLRLIVGQLEEFNSRVRTGLEDAGWGVKRDIIRALVKQVEVGTDQVNVVFRVDPRPFESRPERGMVHFCLGRVQDQPTQRRSLTLSEEGRRENLTRTRSRRSLSASWKPTRRVCARRQPLGGVNSVKADECPLRSSEGCNRAGGYPVKGITSQKYSSLRSKWAVIAGSCCHTDTVSHWRRSAACCH